MFCYFPVIAVVEFTKFMLLFSYRKYLKFKYNWLKKK